MPVCGRVPVPVEARGVELPWSWNDRQLGPDGGAENCLRLDPL